MARSTITILVGQLAKTLDPDIARRVSRSPLTVGTHIKESDPEMFDRLVAQLLEDE